MIAYLEHHIVDHCNLNCAGCSHFSPLAHEWYELEDDFYHDFSALANKIEVQTIRLMGGEPLLHPHVGWFCETARSLFPHADIQLVTNGILLPLRKAELKDTLNNNQIRVCVSNYGFLDMKHILEGIDLVRIDGKAALYNISLDTDGTQDPQFAFDNCDLHQNHWYYFQHGCFYPCCIMANIEYFKKYFNQPMETDNLCISIHDHTEEEIKKFLNTPLAACKYCRSDNRSNSYSAFHQTQKEKTEWIYH